MREFIGDGHRRTLDELRSRIAIIAAGDTELPRVMILEGPSGIGKSRVVRELYRCLRADLDSEGYWPDLAESFRGDLRGGDPLPGRKNIGPQLTGFTWPAGALPGFGWWQLQCEQMTRGDAIDVVAQARPELEAHLVPVALAWQRASSIQQKLKARKEETLRDARAALAEGGLEAASQALASIGIWIPGLGLATTWALRAAHATRDRMMHMKELRNETELGGRTERQRRSVSADLAEMITGVAHPDVPGVVVIEDLHLMDRSLGELLNYLAVPRRGQPVVAVAMAWPESRGAGAYAEWTSQALESGRAEIIPMPYLQTEDLVVMVNKFAPNTPLAVAEQAVQSFPTPLMLEATIGSDVVLRAIGRAGGALPAAVLTSMPRSVEGVYEKRFHALPNDVQKGLAIAAGALPDRGFAKVWPFIRDVVADAAHRCPDMPPPALILDGIEWATENQAWLVPTGIAESFREPLQARIAYEHLADQTFIGLSALTDLQESIFKVLVERIDYARGGGYLLEASDSTSILCSWLLELTPETMVNAQQALLSAAFFIGSDLAAAYQYGAAVDIVEPHMKAASHEHPDLLIIRLNLASWLREAGRVQGATNALGQILTEQQDILGPDHPLTMTIRHNLAYCLKASGHIQQATEIFRQILTDRQRVQGPDHPATLTTRVHLARCMAETGFVQEAVDIFQQVLTDQQRILGADHLDTLHTVVQLARWRWPLSGTKETGDALQQVLNARLRILGPDHPDSLTTRSDLGAFLVEAGYVEEAIDTLQQVLADRQRILGPNHPDTLTTRHNLAYCFHEAGRLQEAINTLHQILADKQPILGTDHPDTLITSHNLACSLRKAGFIQEAIDIFQQVLMKQERSLGSDHPHTLTCRANLARCVGEAGRVQEAIDTLRWVLERKQIIMGANDPSALTTRRTLAIMLDRGGHTREASITLQQVLAEQLKILGAEHPDTQKTLAALKRLPDEP